jgi:hypothetical protein
MQSSKFSSFNNFQGWGVGGVVVGAYSSVLKMKTKAKLNIKIDWNIVLTQNIDLCFLF